MSKPRKISDYPNRADDYESAAEKAHDQNTDTALDEGGDNEVTAEQIRDHVDSTDNPHGVTAGQVGAYTKTEADDLLDGKADKSALNATNQAVSALDGRVDTAEGRIDNNEDGIEALETSKSTRINEEVYLDLGSFGISSQATSYIVLGRADIPSRLMYGGELTLVAGGSNSNIIGKLDLSYVRSETIGGNPYTAITFSEKGTRNHSTAVSRIDSIEPFVITKTGSSEEYLAIRIMYGEAGAGWVYNSVEYRGAIYGNHEFELLTGVDIETEEYYEPGSGGVVQFGGLKIQGDIDASAHTVTADQFITTSHVESDNANALSALDNIAEWKKKDGTIDYKKHYAYTPMIIRDEAGKVIEEKPGLSVEKRIAMLEKMVYELSGQIQNSKTQRK